MNPFFSIVIANYNHGTFLEEAILSVLEQDCTDYELIMVDGGSTDKSLEIINKYKDRFSWWVSEKDNGQSDAFNKGFKKANGLFFLWVNADDLLLPETLKKAKEFLIKNKDCQWLVGNTINMDVNRKFKWCIRGPIFIKWLVLHGTVYVYGPTTFFKKELFAKVEGFDESLYYTMDTDLWYKFLNLGYKFHRLNHYCWAFRIHEESKTAHTQISKPNDSFVAEKNRIETNNNRKVYKITQYLLFIFKVVTGVFFIRGYHNIQKKNTFI